VAVRRGLLHAVEADDAPLSWSAESRPT
jgi:hypothetical protein